MGIKNFVIDENTTVEKLEDVMNDYNNILKTGKDVAFVIKKGALSYDEKIEYKNENSMTRENIINHIVDITNEDPIISTTGKTH